MKYVSEYKYLRYWILKFLSQIQTVEALTARAGRSFRRIINVFKYMGDMGYETYITLYHSYSPCSKLRPSGLGIQNIQGTMGITKSHSAILSRGLSACPTAGHDDRDGLG